MLAPQQIVQFLEHPAFVVAVFLPEIFEIALGNEIAHGIEFDVVYTSWLSRAIETAWLVLNELDSIWLPIIKTWRLNER